MVSKTTMPKLLYSANSALDFFAALNSISECVQRYLRPEKIKNGVSHSIDDGAQAGVRFQVQRIQRSWRLRSFYEASCWAHQSNIFPQIIKPRFWIWAPIKCKRKGFLYIIPRTWNLQAILKINLDNDLVQCLCTSLMYPCKCIGASYRLNFNSMS